MEFARWFGFEECVSKTDISSPFKLSKNTLLRQEQLVTRGRVYRPQFQRSPTSSLLQTEVDFSGDLHGVIDERREDAVQSARVGLEVGVAIDLE